MGWFSYECCVIFDDIKVNVIYYLLVFGDGYGIALDRTKSNVHTPVVTVFNGIAFGLFGGNEYGCIPSDSTLLYY